MMKKIAFLIEDISEKGGRETVLATLANALCDTYDIHILCVTQKNETLAYQLNPNIKYQYFTYFEGRTRERFARSVFKMRRYIKKNRIDCVLGMGSSTFMLATISTIFTKTKFIGCEHSNLKNTFYDPLERLSQKMGAYFSDYLVTLTKKDIQNWIETYHMNPNRIGHCYNAIKTIEKVDDYKVDSRLIMSIGRISNVKQFHLIPQMASQIFEKHPDWKWHIYGSGDAQTIQVLEDEIKKYHMENHVILMGNHPNPHEIYGEYGLFVLCSKYEGLPMVLLEAKQHHLPIVAFDIQTGPSEIVEHQKSGILVEADCVDEMAKQLIYLIENDQIRKEYASHAQDNLYLFEESRIIDQWKTLFENILK